MLFEITASGKQYLNLSLGLFFLEILIMKSFVHKNSLKYRNPSEKIELFGIVSFWSEFSVLRSKRLNLPPSVKPHLTSSWVPPRRNCDSNMNNTFNISTDSNNIFKMMKCSDVGTSKSDHLVIHDFLCLFNKEFQAAITEIIGELFSHNPLQYLSTRVWSCTISFIFNSI